MTAADASKASAWCRKTVWFNEIEGKMARPAGLEPATLGFGNQYSIQLSYERV